MSDLPGVYVDKIEPPTFDMSALDAIRNNLSVMSGDIMDFNGYMTIAQAVASHYGLDVEKRIENWYAQFAGRPITIQSVIIFWMVIFDVGKL